MNRSIRTDVAAGGRLHDVTAWSITGCLHQHLEPEENVARIRERVRRTHNFYGQNYDRKDSIIETNARSRLTCEQLRLIDFWRWTTCVLIGLAMGILVSESFLTL